MTIDVDSAKTSSSAIPFDDSPTSEAMAMATPAHVTLFSLPTFEDIVDELIQNAHANLLVMTPSDIVVVWNMLSIKIAHPISQTGYEHNERQLTKLE